MSRIVTVARHVVSILLLPVTVTIVVPWLLVSRRAATLTPADDLVTTVAAFGGACVLALGLALVVATVRRFATAGQGTLAPWDPPARFVAAGAYRHVRNPMITGVILVLLGEAMALRAAEVLAWAAIVFAVNAIYIPFVEEPGLERRFGDDYRAYKAAVPRWIPRLSPWQPTHPEGPPSAIISR